jgi:hypothetical protein
VHDAAVTPLSCNDGKNQMNVFEKYKCFLEKQQLLVCFKNDTLKLFDSRQNKTLCAFW